MSPLIGRAELLHTADAEVINYPGDRIRVLAPAGSQFQVADYVSTDREGPPAHAHPWDEIQLVVAGKVEFQLDGGQWEEAREGAVQFLPRGISHTLRVPDGEAHLIQVSVGPPYDGFARDMARLFAEGAPLEQIAAVAAAHGVSLA